MFNHSECFSVKLKGDLEKKELYIPNGKYLKSAVISLVKYGSSNFAVHIKMQLGNTKKEINPLVVAFGKNKKNKVGESDDHVYGKVFGYDAIGINPYTFGYVYLLGGDVVNKKEETEEIEEEATED